MEDWIAALKAANNREYYEAGEHHDFLSGHHHWYATSHARPTYCNVCREALSGVTSHGLSCEVCKWKVHKRCAVKAISNCKWTTLASVGKDIIEDDDGIITMPHQWMEGNLPVSAKCAVCDKTCGSVLRLQDWRCLWCRATVHTACRPGHPVRCPLGPSKVSVVPPISLHSVGSDEAWEAVRPQSCSPLLVFVNSKSGDNQGVKFLRRFKQLLNPAQVFDLISGGPGLGLRLFRHFDPFRILVCSGDGSVGWVLSEIDRLSIHKQCQLGVLPLGTGNDLARVLGWGSSCDDDTHLPQLLEKYEMASTKMLDRWSIMTFERSITIARKLSQNDPSFSMSAYEDSVVSHLSKILQSDQHSVVISSAKILCETVKDFTVRAAEVSLGQGDEQFSDKCQVLKDKLDLLLLTLHEEEASSEQQVEVFLPEGEEKSSLEKPEKDLTNMKEKSLIQPTRVEFMQREALMSRANSLKKAVRQLVEHTEQAVDEQNKAGQPDSRRSSKLDIPRADTLKVLPTIESASSTEVSPCPSPNPFLHPSGDFASRLTAISPLPDLRRDSGGEELLPLPVPVEFADHRRSLVPSEDGSSCPSPAQSSLNLNREDKEALSREDKKALSREDKESLGREDKEALSREDKEALSREDKEVLSFPRFELVVTLDEGSDQGSTVLQDIEQVIGHIDSCETTEVEPTAEHGKDDTSEENEEMLPDMERLVKVRGCSLAHFSEGNDIARRSFYRHVKRPGEQLDVVQIQIQGSNNNLSSDVVPTPDRHSFEMSEEEASPFEPIVSVIVNPPSPIMSDDGMDGVFRDDSSDKLCVAWPTSGDHCSPAATRRISSGSLLKSPDSVMPGTQSPGSRDRSRSLDNDDSLASKKLPIINPLVRLPMWPNVSSGAGLVSKVLLANADALCAAASPLMDPDETLLEGYLERSVMNNYFGIGIDAKISLDFHHKREEHPEKCRSRAKNYMWYGVLGSKEWLQKTYKNLEQRVQLECDGQRIPLPSLQGIVILNIPSFMGGTNFWGGTKEDDCFLAPSFDDRILEVVAVFGSVQMAASRLINLQHHRIAQCQTVQINILGDEGVPIQVDGEAWLQPPGMIRIIHKNRMQMLCRNRALETSLRAWEEKQRLQQGLPQSQPSQGKLSPFSEEENQLLLSFIESVTTLVKYVKLLTISHPAIEVELYQLAAQTSTHLEQVHPGGKIVEGPNLRPQVTELVSSARQLYEEACNLLREKAHSLHLREDLEGKLSAALGNMETELRKCVTYDSSGLVHFQQPMSEEQGGERKGRARGLLWLKLRRGGNSSGRAARDVATWGVVEVATWLESLQLAEYADSFTRHDIRGRELLSLGRRDLKELGVTKVGHVKRILQAVRDLTM